MNYDVFDCTYLYLNHKEPYLKTFYMFIFISFICLIVFLLQPYNILKKYEVTIENNQFELLIPADESYQYLEGEIIIHGKKDEYEVLELETNILKIGDTCYDRLVFKLKKLKIYTKKQTKEIIFIVKKTRIIYYIQKTMKGWFQ